MAHTSLTVHLVVKGDAKRARDRVSSLMQKWYAETPESACVKDEGFPTGTLLYFRFDEKEYEFK